MYRGVLFAQLPTALVKEIRAKVARRYMDAFLAQLPIEPKPVLWKRVPRVSIIARSHQNSIDLLSATLGDIAELPRNQHPDVAMTLNNMATLCIVLEAYTDAESYFQVAQNILENADPNFPNYPVMAIILKNNLGKLYQGQKKFSDAERSYKDALNLQEKVNPRHSDMATILNNLALLFMIQEKYRDAEDYYKSVLSIWAKESYPVAKLDYQYDYKRVESRWFKRRGLKVIPLFLHYYW
ncbi:tetratricopeptide repeat protein [Nostoc sp. UHCC 0302]|uniref:tetratricopeptide repeat protein n=1 Tax=Nostoc sp. UHCC 0302 TaxID=3134896 RepID=UPI00311CAD98